MNKTIKNIKEALNALSAYEYRLESCDPKWNAQQNLGRRTHFVDDDTLNGFRSRILRSWVPFSHTDKDGLLFALTESNGSKPHDGSKNKRATLFDVFGTVVFKTDWHRKSDKAETELYTFLDAFDVSKYYKSEIKERINRMRNNAMSASKALSGKG